MKHELKIWPQYYQRVAEGTKTFEVRKNDRKYQMGDEVVLYYYDPKEHDLNANVSLDWIKEMFTKTYPPLSFKVGFVLDIDNERVVFSLLPSVLR
jgi:ASC-1-like (ASCH) protein